PAHADVWVPLDNDVTTLGYVLDVVGRLKPRITLEQARTDLARVHSQIPAAKSHNGVLTSPVAVPLREHYLGGQRVAAQCLLAASILVLLAASANVAGLMMARGAARSPEVAVRRALGARSGRIARQLLVEGIVLTSIASVAGVALGWLALRALLALS